MKRKNFFAVVVTIVTLCAVTSCSSYDAVADEGIITPVREKSCNFISLSTPKTEGAITRSAEDIDFTKPDGRYSVTTKAKMTFDNALPEDSVKWHEIIHNLIPYGVLNKPLYIRDFDKFINTKPTITPVQIPDGRMGNWVVNEGANRYNLVEENSIDFDSTYVRDINGKRVGFARCKDAWAKSPTFVKRTKEDLHKDSAKWHFYRIYDEYKPYLTSGLDCPIFKVVYTALVWTGKGDPDFPDDDWDAVLYFTKNEWIHYVDPNTGNSGFDVYAWLSDGSEKFYKKKDIDLSNSIEIKDRDTITVDDFDWKSLNAVLYNEGTDGALYEKKDSIWVQPLKKMYQTNINKGSREYLLKREGRAYWVDPFGEKHYFKEAEWETANADKGWSESSLAEDKTYDYTLLTSSIAPTYLEYEHKVSSELALRALKDGGKKAVNAEYSDKGIRMITPIGKYYTYATKWLILSDNTKEKVGEVGTYIGASVVSPEPQTIDVTDWSITDGQAQWYGEQRQTARTDTVSNGTFRITPWSKNYVTKTNKSSHKFVVTWDKTVIYTDEFGNDVDFIGLEPTPSDKGGVSTLKALSNEGDYERKEMTTTMNLVVREDNADYSGTVIFRKPAEKEPDVPHSDFDFDANWHSDKANRFYTGVKANDGQWCDGFLYANDTDYFIVVYFFKLVKENTGEKCVDTKTYTIPKSEMMTPSADRQYDAVMWDRAKGKPLPCRIAVDGSGWTLATRYADGTLVDKREGQEDANISGIKNQPQSGNAKSTPWLENASWSEETKDGHVYYHAAWHTLTHTMSHTVGLKVK